MTDVSKPPE